MAFVGLFGVVAPLGAEDPTVAEQVVAMLEAELSEEIILEWLSGESEAVASLSAGELVALKKAGASDELMKRLLTMARSARDSRSRSEPAIEPEVQAAPETVAPSPPAHSPATAQAAPVTLHVSYLPQVDEYEVADERPWDLYVYIDGIPVTYLPVSALQSRPETLEFARSIPAGTHTVRVTQERHYEVRGRWHHDTRAATPAFQFELQPELPARLEVEFHERLMDYSDPLVFQLTQGERVLDSERVGGQAESWPSLCYDVRASVPEGKKPTRRQRQRLETCVEWDSWWGLDSVPSRREVLDAMAEFDFRPRPRGS